MGRLGRDVFIQNSGGGCRHVRTGTLAVVFRRARLRLRGLRMRAEAKNVPAQNGAEFRAEGVGDGADARVMRRLFLLCVGAVIAEEQARGHARAAQRAAHFAHPADAAAKRRRQTQRRVLFQPRVLRERKQHRLRTVVALEKIRSCERLMLCHLSPSSTIREKLRPPHFLQTQLRVFGCCSSSCTIFPRRR